MEGQTDEIFYLLREKAGTIEFPSRRLATKKILKGKANVVKELDRIVQAEQLVFFAIGEHWRLKLQNRALVFKLTEQAGEQGGILLEQLTTKLKPAFIKLKQELGGFATSDKSERDESKLAEIKYYVEKQVPELIQLVFHARLVNVFDRPLAQLEAAIRQTTEKHQFAAPVS